MMLSSSKLNGWKRLWVFIAIIWAFPVTAYTVVSWPTENESEIYTQWANEKVDLIRKHHDPSKPISAYRRQMYGNSTDKQIIYSAPLKGPFDSTTLSVDEAKPWEKYQQTPDGHFEPSTAVPVDELEAIYQRYELRLLQLEEKSPFITVLSGVVIWLIPLIIIYMLGVGVRWVYLGFHGKSS